jgi:hypothetical protein
MRAKVSLDRRWSTPGDVPVVSFNQSSLLETPVGWAGRRLMRTVYVSEIYMCINVLTCNAEQDFNRRLQFSFLSTLHFARFF